MDKNFRINICGESIQNRNKTMESTSMFNAIQASYDMCQPKWWLGSWNRIQGNPEIIQRDIQNIDKQVIGTIHIKEIEK